MTDWVAKAGAKVIGFAQCVHHPEPHSPWAGYWLFSLTVWRRYRGFGIGEALSMRHRICQGSRRRTAVFAVFSDNGSAMCMYSKLGFEHITLPALEPGLAAEAHQFGRRRIIMCKRLKVC